MKKITFHFTLALVGLALFAYTLPVLIAPEFAYDKFYILILIVSALSALLCIASGFMYKRFNDKKSYAILSGISTIIAGLLIPLFLISTYIIILSLFGLSIFPPQS